MTEATRHDPDASGRCRWCGGRTQSDPIRKPTEFGRRDTDDSELGTAYRYFYDPDWGADKYDD